MLLSEAALKPFMSQIDKVNKYIVDVALLREAPDIHEVIRLVEAEASSHLRGCYLQSSKAIQLIQKPITIEVFVFVDFVPDAINEKLYTT